MCLRWDRNLLAAGSLKKDKSEKCFLRDVEETMQRIQVAGIGNKARVPPRKNVERKWKGEIYFQIFPI